MRHLADVGENADMAATLIVAGHRAIVCMANWL
jgi:hypothetical protein